MNGEGVVKLRAMQILGTRLSFCAGKRVSRRGLEGSVTYSWYVSGNPFGRRVGKKRGKLEKESEGVV